MNEFKSNEHKIAIHIRHNVHRIQGPEVCNICASIPLLWLNTKVLGIACGQLHLRFLEFGRPPTLEKVPKKPKPISLCSI